MSSLGEQNAEALGLPDGWQIIVHGRRKVYKSPDGTAYDSVKQLKAAGVLSDDAEALGLPDGWQVIVHGRRKVYKSPDGTAYDSVKQLKAAGVLSDDIMSKLTLQGMTDLQDATEFGFPADWKCKVYGRSKVFYSPDGTKYNSLIAATQAARDWIASQAGVPISDRASRSKLPLDVRQRGTKAMISDLLGVETAIDKNRVVKKPNVSAPPDDFSMAASNGSSGVDVETGRDENMIEDQAQASVPPDDLSMAAPQDSSGTSVATGKGNTSIAKKMKFSALADDVSVAAPKDSSGADVDTSGDRSIVAKKANGSVPQEDVSMASLGESSGGSSSESSDSDQRASKFEAAFRKRLATCNQREAQKRIAALRYKIAMNNCDLEQQTGCKPTRLKMFLDEVERGVGIVNNWQKELDTMTLGALKRRARNEGVADKRLEQTDDADDPREAVIALILGATVLASGNLHVE